MVSDGLAGRKEIENRCTMDPFDTLADVIMHWVHRDRPQTALRICLEWLGLLLCLVLTGASLFLQFR